MKTYEMLINGAPATNDYIRGRISGFITVLTGMPDMTYGWTTDKTTRDWLTKYIATEDQHKAIKACIEKYYPDAYVGVRVIE